MIWIIIAIVIAVIFITTLAFWLIGERWHLLRPSTWAMLRANGLRRIFNLSAIHGYIYGRWTIKYLGILRNLIYPRLGTRGMRWLRNSYHGKVLTQENAESIILLNHDIPLQDLEQIIPYTLAREIVLTGPPDVVVSECGCRNNRREACQPTQVCMVVGKPFTDFILEHHPSSSRRLTQVEAIELLRKEHERGHMHTAWFKDALIDRFYVICNCCKCCCLGVEFMMKYGNPVMASSGYIAQLDENLCKGCGICVNACPFNALSIKDQISILDWDKCMGCGICEVMCPNNARSVVLEERKGTPLDVRLLVGKENPSQ
ncbi:MAG: 4Fe-4S binding protein [Chloroflexi bacterium]|nr:4Fe-4S binding protein [Chloroflexota bacterium]